MYMRENLSSAELEKIIEHWVATIRNEGISMVITTVPEGTFKLGGRSFSKKYSGTSQLESMVTHKPYNYSELPDSDLMFVEAALSEKARGRIQASRMPENLDQVIIADLNSKYIDFSEALKNSFAFSTKTKKADEPLSFVKHTVVLPKHHFKDLRQNILAHPDILRAVTTGLLPELDDVAKPQDASQMMLIINMEKSKGPWNLFTTRELHELKW